MATKDLKDVVNDQEVIIKQLNSLVESMKAVNKEYDEFGAKIEETAKKISENQKKSSGANKQEQDQLDENAKAADRLLRAQEAYRRALSENEQEIRNIRQSQRELIKQRQLEQRVTEAAEGSYDQLSARYALIKRRLNAMSREEREATESGRALVAQAAEIRAEMSRLQRETGNHTLTVGNYENANRNLVEVLGELPGGLSSVGEGVEGLQRSFLKLLTNPWIAIFTAIAAAIVAVGRALKDTRAGSAAFAKGMNNVTSALDVGKARLRDFATELHNTFSEEGIKGVMKEAEETLFGSFKKFRDDWKEVGLREAIKKDIERTKDTFNEFKDEVDAVKALKDQLVDMQNALVDNEETLTLLIADQQHLTELQTSLADDATKSFLDRENAAESSRKSAEVAAEAEIKLAKERLAIEDQNIKIAEELREIDSATGKAITKNAIEIKKARLEAYLELKQAENDYTLTIRENEKQRAELASDRLERDLDILIDGFDNQKTINERIIADDKNTLAERFELLDETEKLFEKTFNKQIETIQTMAKEQIDMNDLIATSDATVLNEKIRGLGLSEIWEGRLLEAIRERRTMTQDLAEVESDLNAKAIEEKLELFDQEKELQQLRLENAGATAEKIKNLEINTTIERYEKQLELAKTYGQDISDAEIAIIQEKIKALEKDLEADEEGKGGIWERLGFTEEQGAQAVSNLKQAANATMEILTTFADQRIEQADRAVEASNAEVESAERNLDRQITLAEQGYAADLSGAQAQLNLQKQTQDEALAEQQAALKAKQRLDSLEQGASLITASANILKGWSTVPFIGQLLGAAAIAAMFSAFAITKVKARKAAQFSHGGYEEIGGGTHASGNDTVIGYNNETELRAERGESIGVFTGKARQKYGKLLPGIVEDANKLKLEDRFSNSFNIDYASMNNNSYGYDSHELKEIKQVLMKMEAQGGNNSSKDKKGRRIEKTGNITRIIS